MEKLNPRRSGTALAMAAATVLAAGCAADSTAGDGVAAGSTDLVHCYGVNKCNGHNDCKGAGNECAGHGSCKGQGFVAMPSKACGDVGGSVRDAWRGQVAKADLSKCYGVNKCNGHNDCQTATNSCAGHAKCNGTGWVSMPAKSCGDIGGKVG